MFTCFKAIISEQNYCPQNYPTMPCNVSLSLKYVLTKGLNNFSVESKPFKEWKKRNIFDIKVNTGEWDIMRRGEEGGKQVWAP